MYLHQDAAGNLLLLPGQGETLEEVVGLADGEGSHLADISAVDANRPCFGTQPRSLAVGASRIAAILTQHHAHVQLVFLALQVSEETMDAEKRPVSVKHELLLRRGQFSPRRVQRDAVLQGGFAQLCLVRAILGPRPGIDRAFVQASSACPE